jgi:hypothetical protein
MGDNSLVHIFYEFDLMGAHAHPANDGNPVRKKRGVGSHGAGKKIGDKAGGLRIDFHSTLHIVSFYPMTGYKAGYITGS